jgi:hypothetical protein
MLVSAEPLASSRASARATRRWRLRLESTTRWSKKMSRSAWVVTFELFVAFVVKKTSWHSNQF